MIERLFSILKDGIEILFFSSAIYIFCLWLKKDARHNLLIHFFSYCIIFCVSVLLNLATVVSFLTFSAPIVLLLFIIFHQELLQRNFITLTNMQIATVESSDWLEQLIRASLHAINNNKQLICAIEHRNSLRPFLFSPLIFNSVLAQNLITLLIDSPGFDQKKIFWCSSQGRLVGINSEWQVCANETWQSQSVIELPTWKQDALLMTLKTDTLVFKADPNKRAFDVVIKGTAYENLTAHQTLSLLKKYLTISTHIKGDVNNGHITQKHNPEQLNH